MQPAEREMLSLIGTMSSIVHVLLALAVLVLGLVVVRPLNKVAGVVYAGAGVCRGVGVILSALVRAMQPEHPDMKTMLAINGVTTLIWIITSALFFGGVIVASIKFADTHVQPQRGAW